MKELVKILLLLGSVSVMVSCNDQTTKQDKAEGGMISAINISGSHFVDQQGRQMFFNGLNLVNKNPDDHFVSTVNDRLISKTKKWGINMIRFGLNWSALEPKPGQINEDYLDKVQAQVEKLTAAGIFVFLDMHQDLYGAKFGGGAPEWATLDEGLPHEKGAIWSDAYLISPAVQQAFDSFWANKEAQGQGLQDHYADAWKKVAQRFADNDRVVGYDLMNEPFIGSGAQLMLKKMLQTMGHIIEEEKDKSLSPQEVEQIWSDPQQRAKALVLLEDTTLYKRILEPLIPIHQHFEREQLQPFYQKVAEAIRQVDQESILFLEHGYFSNLGIPSAVERTTLKNGQADSLVAYAPHAYDLVVDTDYASQASQARMEYIFNKIAETARQKELPVLLGEWGAFYGGEDEQMVSTARRTLNQIEKHQFSETYWSYFPELGRQPYFREVLLRPVPAAIAGELIEYEQVENEFKMSWNENTNISAPTLILIPHSFNRQELKVELKEDTQWELKETEEAIWLEIETTANDGMQTVTIKAL